MIRKIVAAGSYFGTFVCAGFSYWLAMIAEVHITSLPLRLQFTAALALATPVLFLIASIFVFIKPTTASFVAVVGAGLSWLVFSENALFAVRHFGLMLDRPNGIADTAFLTLLLTSTILCMLELLPRVLRHQE